VITTRYCGVILAVVTTMVGDVLGDALLNRTG